MDRALIIALLLALAFSLHGIHWGSVEEWNPDQMAFKTLFHQGELPLNPKEFLKPPFHTYFNFFLSTVPFYVLGNILSVDFLHGPRLLWSRALTVLLFMGSVILVFQISKRFFGIFAARMITLLFSTSAGFIAFNHFLTVDIPVMFWMLLAFCFTQNILIGGSVRDYLLSGFFTGIATATKYNGLGVGIALVVAHLLSLKSDSWKEAVFDKKLVGGLLLVAVGFIVGNPFSVLDYPTFILDFMRNYAITPVYDGVNTGHGYAQFFVNMVEIVGLPSFLVFSLGAGASWYLLFRVKGISGQKKGMLLLLSVLLLYYWKIGSFPRLPVRFVLPVVPVWLMMSGPFWERIRAYGSIWRVLFVILISYNLVCSFYVGNRFLEDPRMEAQSWVKVKIPEHSSIEFTNYSPDFNKIVSLEAKGMPFISGKARLLGPLFREDLWVREIIAQTERLQDESWYSLERLMIRQPEYIAINSLYYERFIDSKTGDLYPSIEKFFAELIGEKYPYKIVFDRESKKPPTWVYPQKIDFLHNRMTILKREVSPVYGK